MGKLSTGDRVRLVSPGDRRNQAVKPRVNGQVEPRSFEVETENGEIYRRNQRHLRRTKEEFKKTESAVGLHSGASSPAERVCETPSDTPSDLMPEVPPERTREATPLRQTSVPELSVSSSKPPVTKIATMQPLMVTRPGRTVKKPKYLGDHV